MKGQGVPQGPCTKVEWEIEEDVVKNLAAMEKHSAMPLQNLVHIALKRFISQHHDYLPPPELQDDDGEV